MVDEGWGCIWLCEIHVYKKNNGNRMIGGSRRIE